MITKDKDGIKPKRRSKGTWKNKVFATMLLITGVISVVPSGNATWLIISIFAWFMLFFSEHNYFK